MDILIKIRHYNNVLNTEFNKTRRKVMNRITGATAEVYFNFLGNSTKCASCIRASEHRFSAAQREEENMAHLKPLCMVKDSKGRDFKYRSYPKVANYEDICDKDLVASFMSHSMEGVDKRFVNEAPCRPYTMFRKCGAHGCIETTVQSIAHLDFIMTTIIGSFVEKQAPEKRCNQRRDKSRTEMLGAAYDSTYISFNSKQRSRLSAYLWTKSAS